MLFIAQTVDIKTFKCHLLNAPKEDFWPKYFFNFKHKFKSAILAIFQFWQNGTL